MVVVPIIYLIVFGSLTYYSGKDFVKYLKKKVNDRKHMKTDLKGAPLRFKDARVSISELRPGDHIFTQLNGSIGRVLTPKRWLSRVGYHHGIFLGEINGVLKVADFGRENDTHPVITTLDEFMYGNTSAPLYRRSYTSGYIHPVEKTLEEAFLLEECEDWGPYDLVKNNCEHFSTFLKTGKQWSSQVYKAY